MEDSTLHGIVEQIQIILIPIRQAQYSDSDESNESRGYGKDIFQKISVYSKSKRSPLNHSSIVRKPSNQNLDICNTDSKRKSHVTMQKESKYSSDRESIKNSRQRVKRVTFCDTVIVIRDNRIDHSSIKTFIDSNKQKSIRYVFEKKSDTPNEI